MNVSVISDTHGQHEKVKVDKCDVLICCGDVAGRNKEAEYESFFTWFCDQPAAHKLFVPGNHDKMTHMYGESKFWDCNILIDCGLSISGFEFWGSPWSPKYGNWRWQMADPWLFDKFNAMPQKLDVLITHGPPKYILDMSYRQEHIGSESLLEVVSRRDIRYNVFGHVHEHGGCVQTEGPTTFINAAVVDLRCDARLSEPMRFVL